MTSATPPSPSAHESPAPSDNPGPPSSAERVPLPAWTPPAPPLELARADWLLAALVVALAFLVASTPARNSDLWLHLATGRALAGGSYRFHGDPFGPDTTTWVAHSWLCDLAGHAVYDRLGGGVLVFLKAVLASLLAALLLRLGSRERGLAWPAVGATLAVLALCGRLLLQPALVSVLLLAVTLYLLDRARREREAANRASWLRAYGPICVLFALWANVDDWFLLGPVTVALSLLGEIAAAIGRAGDRERADLPGLALLLGAGLLACLLNPFHVHVFALPAELGLSATAEALEQDPVLQGLFVSPFEGTYFRAGAVWSFPGVAYLVLIVLGVLSFAGSRQGRRSWRLPVWLGLFALSAWSVRAVPFFAVAAGPILALNVQDLASRPRSAGPGRDAFFLARLGRAAAILVLLGLLVAAWPGWLQGAPYEMRRWAVLADPSLRAVAEQLDRWRREGLLGANERGFDFSPETANYFAWFCPAEKGVVDSRLHVSADEAADYVAVRRALLAGPSAKTGWRGILRGRHVNHVVLYDSNAERVQTVYHYLVRNEQEWPLLLLSGRTAVFGWVDPERAETAHVADLRLRPDRAAYQPSESEEAPAEWPGRGPEPSPWWKAFITSRPAGSPDRDEAGLLLLHFEALGEPTLIERGLAWEASLIAGAVGAGTSSPGCVQQALDLACAQVLHPDSPLDPNRSLSSLERFALAVRENYFRARDDAPPELLWLAIRAARRALHDNPDDAYAYLILGEAYLRLANNTRERAWTGALPFLSRLREVQASAALNQALLLQPDLVAAHAGLVRLYRQQGQWDLRLHQLREVLRLTQARGRLPHETPQEWDERLSRLKDEVQRLDAGLKRLLDGYEVAAGDRKIIERVEAAASRGLGGKALEILLASDAAALGQRGVHLELHLLLTTGRVNDVRQWLLPEHRETLGNELYFLVRMEVAAACGDYELADADLAELAAGYEQSIEVNGIKIPPRQAMSLGISHAILDGASQNQSLGQRYAVLYSRDRFLGSVGGFGGVVKKVADLETLRGLLALERGYIAGAREHFARALEVYQSEEAVASGGGLDFGGRPIAEHFLRLLRSQSR
jgi:tetratricopeptide (TPR) repeat protein